MSTPEEHIATSKPKRKYTKRAKVDMPPAAPTPEKTNIPGDLPINPKPHVFEHTCTVPISSHIGTANNGDRIKIYEYCQNEAKFVPTIHFTGLREDPSPHNPKKLIPTETHVSTRFGAVCEMHRQKIQTDINVLVDSRELESLSGQ